MGLVDNKKGMVKNERTKSMCLSPHGNSKHVSHSFRVVLLIAISKSIKNSCCHSVMLVVCPYLNKDFYVTGPTKNFS